MLPILVGLAVFWGLRKRVFMPIPKGDMLHLLPKLEFHPSIKKSLANPLHVNLEPFKQRALLSEDFLGILENSITVWVGLVCVGIGLMLFF